jgi:transmembrane sensor
VRRDALAYLRRESLLHLLPRPRRLTAIAAGLVLCVLAGAGLWQYMQFPTEYHTGVGQRLVVSLDDGSRISLDSDTAVSVRYTKNARRLILEQGRARFDVAHDIMRPFTVTAGKETVVAVGTSFDVERLGEKILVTLIEGRVVVKSAAPSGDSNVVRTSARTPKALTLHSGQLLVASGDAKPSIRPADLPVATAWETGRLILNNEPLGEAVERVNRYTDKPLLVDPTIAQLRVSGVFNAGDIATFVDAVTTLFPVQASVNDANQTVLQKRS